MKFSEAELKDLFQGKLKLSTAELSHQLTMLGLEVDACEPVAPMFTGVIVGTVLQAVQHPNADRLRVCQVSTGSGLVLNIVCGAPNARAGIKVAVAYVGACLPGDFMIKETKLRGELSQGMLCSEKELGLPESLDGILELPMDAPLGVDLRDYLQLNDNMLTINLTPNRGDCLNLYGIAREIAVLNHLPVPTLEIKPVKTRGADVPVKIMEKQACPRYCLAVLEGIDNTVATPKEVKQRLERSGIRSISPVVDILNDVMILCGQPMHAFDADRVSGMISVEWAKDGEKIELLNDETLALREDTLTIRDEKSAIALAGVMGSKPSSVDAGTKKILIEAAFFDPLVVAGKARSYGLHTDASHRFERGVDPMLPQKALALALEKLRNVVGGECLGIVVKEDKAHLPKAQTILLHPHKIKKLLGVAVRREFAISRLQALGCEILTDEKNAILLKVPSYRFDLRIEEDLIEELVRLQGYDSIPLDFPKFSLVEHFPAERVTPILRIKDFLLGEGLHEVVSYSFIDEDMQRVFFDEIQYVLENPISKELASMRKSIVPSLLSILQYNLNRQQTALSIFEVGPCFKDIPPKEVETVAGLLYGKPVGWQRESLLDFYDLKGLIQKLFAFARVSVEFKPTGAPVYLHPGQSLSLWVQGKCVGYGGALHPKRLEQFDLKLTPFVFELSTAIFREGEGRQALPISKFPLIERDLAFLVARDLSASAIVQAVKSVKSPLLQNVSVFDVYAGERLPAHQKSIAIKLSMQDLTRTLVDEEVDKFIAAVIRKVSVSCQAVLRDE